LVIGFGFILGATFALIVRKGRDTEIIQDELFESKDTSNLDALTMEVVPAAMTPLENLPPLPIPAGMELPPIQPAPEQGGETNE
jgi:hypothetical protein